jgi:aromatic-L-amino-acid decarboxylase
MMDWAGDLLGLSSAFSNASGVGGGVLQVCWIVLNFPCLPAHIFRRQTTASDSALVIVVAARALYMRNHPDARLEDLVVYTTTQTHSLGSKAALVLGLQVRSIEVKQEHEFALQEDALRSALESDVKFGRKPFILSAACSNNPFKPKQLT